MSAAANISAEAEALMAKLPAISRPLIAKYFRSDFDVLQKADDSPVPIADKCVEAALRAAITQRFPDHSIIGEEEGGQASQPYCWVIDPIDGTRAFIIGKPLFGTLIALSYQGMPICGLIDMPALDETYITRGGEAFLLSAGQEKKLATRQTDSLANAHIATTSPEAFTDRGGQVFKKLGAACHSTHYGGDCYNYALLAAGHLDLVIEEQLAPHDIMALVPVMQAAGAVVTDWQGAPVHLEGDGSILAAVNASLHEKALAYLG